MLVVAASRVAVLPLHIVTSLTVKSEIPAGLFTLTAAGNEDARQLNLRDAIFVGAPTTTL